MARDENEEEENSETEDEANTGFYAHYEAREVLGKWVTYIPSTYIPIY